MEACFAISPRGEHQAIPERDARRVSAMRRLAKARLEYCGLAALADDVELIVSELITNAIEHSHGTITMTLGLNNGLLSLEVKDGSGRRPQIQRPAEDAESGRGLILVQAITEQRGGSWGCGPDGTNTWCTIPVGAGRGR
ncbi:ATP-binding protein (plasmid) [Streptomyces sp. NBC_01527]|uniref:ATP-binding protein n=1 Tax=Streptomyces sp. NBC_01527 TaxID=2903894 RepID=UPI002F9092FB